jgi:cytochrome b subunit of formate dehydrogenase
MARVHDVSRNGLPPAAGGSINGMRLLMAFVLLLLFVAAVGGVVMALSSGQWQIALLIGLISAAFFSRVGC